MTTNEWVTVILSSSALISSVVLTISQIRIARIANGLPVGIDLLREYRSIEFKSKADHVYQLLGSTVNFSRLSVTQIAEINYVSHFYDNVGLLVHKKIIAKETIILLGII